MVCAAKGNPIPMVTIYYEQVLVNSIIVARGTGVANATFAPVQTQHAGRYVCSIRSKRSAVRREIRLRVACEFTIIPYFLSVHLSISFVTYSHQLIPEFT